MKAQLAAAGRPVADRILDEMAALAELADLAPIPYLASIVDGHAAPPLHLTVDGYVLTYVIDRVRRTIQVVAMEQPSP